MVIYASMTIISALFMYLSSKYAGFDIWGNKLETSFYNSKMKSALFFALSAFVVYFVMAFRYDVGTDYLYTYVPRFYTYQDPATAHQNWEPIFKLLYLVMVRVSDNPQIVFVVTSALIILPTWLAIRELSPMPWLSIIIWVLSMHFFMAMNIVRQCVSLSFVLLAFIYVKKRNFMKYALFIVIATLCHYSAIIFLPLYVLIYISISPTISVLVISVFSIFSKYILSLIRVVIAKTNSITHYLGYYNSSYNTGDRFDKWTFLSIVFVYVMSLIITNQIKIEKDESTIRFFYNLNLINMLFAFNLFLVPSGERISWAFNLATMIYYPMMITRLPSRKHRVIAIGAMVLVFGFIMYMCIFVFKQHGVYPYHFYLTQGNGYQ